jgi:hypothetical protein
MAMREVRCGACGTLNRVPSYSIRRIPQCGKCHTILPETSLIRVARKLVAIPRVVLIGVPAVLLIGWIVATQPAPVASRSTATPQAATCMPGPTATIQGIYRVYDTRDQPRLTQWTINAGAGADYFIKLVDASIGLPKVSYLVRGGSTVTTDVPVGVFTVKHASGAFWCGENDLFGPNTALQKGTRVAVFDDDHTYTLFLTPRPNGNFPTTFIPRSDF